jgi:uncharacterized coiled-coil DUF342 family protein
MTKSDDDIRKRRDKIHMRHIQLSRALDPLNYSVRDHFETISDSAVKGSRD